MKINSCAHADLHSLNTLGLLKCEKILLWTTQSYEDDSGPTVIDALDNVKFLRLRQHSKGRGFRTRDLELWEAPLLLPRAESLF